MTLSTKSSSLAVFFLASLLAVQAIVTPNGPGPGDVFKAGGTCEVDWQGDKDSPTDWKDMSIELMSGDNFNMKHITTVATKQDGSTDGRFSYTCPEVDPYSAIYFYQFTSPHSNDKTWTTRFTISSPDGATTPPANPTQPDGKAIPWGIGNLVDPSTAVPPPGAAGAEVGANSTSTTSGSGSSTTSAPSTSGTSHVSSGTSKLVTSTSSSAASNPTGTAANQNNAALGSLVGTNVVGAIFATVGMMVTAPLWL